MQVQLIVPPGTVTATDQELSHLERDVTRGEEGRLHLDTLEFPIFKPASLSVIEKELEEAGELGPSAIKATIEGLRVSSVYQGKNTPVKQKS